MQELLAWQKEFNVPEEAVKATSEWERDLGLVPLRRDELDKIRERLAEGGDRESLWRHLDSEDWVW